jgi:hypothetical protein
MRIANRCWIAGGVAALGIGIAVAASPHFIFATDTLNFDNGNLTCSWKEAGLGTNQNIDYACTAHATVTLVCVNHGGSNPSAANKTNISEDVGATGTFSSGKNGQITASLTVEPPGAGDFSCPNGQSMETAQVSYTGVLLSDATNGITVPLDDKATGCLLPDVRGACTP